MFRKPEPPYLGVAYYPEDWPDDQLEKDLDRMVEIGINAVRIAEFAWHRMEPADGQFDFSFFHKVIDAAKARGIAVVMGTPTATPPAWFFKKHPDAAVVNAAGVRTQHGGRRHFCSNSPVYDRYSMRVVEAMAKEFADEEAVIGWQIDNEIYTFEPCCCDNCVEKFRRYLERKYGTIEDLNEKWNLNLFSQWYDSFDDIPAPVNAWHNPHLKFEWYRFGNDSHIAFVHRQAEILHRYVKVPVGTDTMPFNGMDYRELTKELDIVQFNHYNVPENLHCEAFWFDYLRTLKDRPFWNTETAANWNGSTAITQSIKPEGYCVVNSWMPIALGGEANMYWLWRTHWAGHELMHGAVIDTSGRDMHTTGEVMDVAKGFRAAADFINGTKVVTDVAIHYTESSWNMHRTQNVVQNWEYTPTVQERFYRPMAECGLRPDVIDAYQELEKYRLLFSPMAMTLEEHGMAERIEKWVREGGTWVAGPLTDVRDAIGARYRDRYYGMLERLTGVKWRYSIPDTEGHIKAEYSDGLPFAGEKWFELSDADEGALVKVTEGHSAINGSALVYKKRVGKGNVIVLGTVPSKEDMKKLLSLACGCAGVTMPKCAGELIVSPREGKGVSGVILAEYGDKTASYTLANPAVDLLTGRKLNGTVDIAPYEVLVLRYGG